MKAEYLIRKGGYYYRPNSAGYTTSKIEAGRYTKEDAEREASIEPWHMSAIHQDDVPDDKFPNGYRILAPGELDAETLEAAAKVADEKDNYWNIVAYDRRQACRDDNTACARAAGAAEIAADIRALKGGSE